MTAFLERATELTPDPHLRVERALLAAQAKLDVADHKAATDLVTAAHDTPLDALQRARLERLRAQIAFATRRGNDAPPLLLDAARRLEPLDAEAASETYLEAIAAAVFAGRLSTGPPLREIARSALAAPPATAPRDRLLTALATRFTEGYAAALPGLSSALHLFGDVDDPRWLWLACRLAQDLWDDELWHVLATRGVESHARPARSAPSRSRPPTSPRCMCTPGRSTPASVLIDEIDAITQATGIAPVKFAALMLAAWRGDQAQALALLDPGLQDATARGEGSGLGMYGWATALLHNAAGRHDEALAAAQRACEHEDVILYGWALVELIEAGARVGRMDAAVAALERLSERTRASGTEWALGIEAASRALVSDAGSAEPLYRESVERLARSRGAVHLARAQLRYGEWLRREHRRTEAREQLRAAHDSFSRFGPGRSPSAPGASCSPPARPRAGSRSRRATSSPRRRCRSHGWPVTGIPTPRSARGCSSARGPSSTTCTRSSASSTSRPARSFDACWPTTPSWVTPSAASSERVAQGGDGLRDGGPRRPAVAERVEHHEVVRGAVVADGGDRDAGLAQARRVGLALVAQHVGLVDDDQGRREPGELLDRSRAAGTRTAPSASRGPARRRPRTTPSPSR